MKWKIRRDAERERVWELGGWGSREKLEGSGGGENHKQNILY